MQAKSEKTEHQERNPTQLEIVSSSSNPHKSFAAAKGMCQVLPSQKSGPQYAPQYYFFVLILIERLYPKPRKSCRYQKKSI